MKTLKFIDVEIGPEFSFFGQTFRKTAASCAEDAEHIGHLFLADTEVEVEADELAIGLNAGGH